MQIRRTADSTQQVAAVQFRGDRDGVGRLTAPVQVQDCVVDVLVRGAVEVPGPQPLEHVGDGVLAQQHAAEHGLFGREVLRWLTSEVLAGRRRIHARRQIIDDCHGFPSPVLHSSEHTFDSRH